MTRGSVRLDPYASIYDSMPVLLFDRFLWDERNEIRRALRSIFADCPRWKFSGAYVYWAQLEGEGGQILYCGEAEELSQRHGQHLRGPAAQGNKFGELQQYFSAHPTEKCGLALLVVPPNSLRWLEPPDDDPFLEVGEAKRAGEELEGLLLRACINLFGKRPPFNSRKDESKYPHNDDVVRFQSLVRYLLDYEDVTMDFTTFLIRAERSKAAAHLNEEIRRCPALARRTDDR